jgi:D-glycero-alpha-D-manno-heptose-7-phosphate kinase
VLIRARAPLRVSFAGGGTDVPPFSDEEGGCVLSATISRYAYGSLKSRDDGGIQIESLDYGLKANYSADDRLVLDGNLDLVKAAITNMVDRDRGFDLFLHSDAPPGSGLGSSSAMIVCLVGLLAEWRGQRLTDYEIADLAYTIERSDLGIPGGLQDQYAAAFGGFNYIEFMRGNVVVNPLRIPQSTVNELQYNLLLVFTGQVRLSAHIIEDQVERYRSGASESRDALRRLKVLTGEMKNCLLQRKLDEFGALLHEEWEHKKRMSDRISHPSLDHLYEVARSEGALGGKITGAGGGGYMLLYCPFERKHIIAQRLTDLGCQVASFDFEEAGLQTWRVNGAD